MTKTVSIKTPLLTVTVDHMTAEVIPMEDADAQRFTVNLNRYYRNDDGSESIERCWFLVGELPQLKAISGLTESKIRELLLR